MQSSKLPVLDLLHSWQGACAYASACVVGSACLHSHAQRQALHAGLYAHAATYKCYTYCT